MSTIEEAREQARETLIATRKLVHEVLEQSRTLPLDVQSAQVMLVLLDAGYSKGPRPITDEMVLAAHDAEKRAEWEAEQGWEYAIGAQSEDRPGKFWRDSDWDTTTELHEALGDLEDALPVFSNAVVIRRRPSTPWLPVPDTTNNEGRAEHDLDRMGICTRCGHGITARELLDGDEQCTTNSKSEDEK